MDLELEDEDVRIAVRALGDMRNGSGQSVKQPFVFPSSSNNNNSNLNMNNTISGMGMSSPSGSTSHIHTPALSLSLTSTHPASSPPHTPPGENDGINDRGIISINARNMNTADARNTSTTGAGEGAQNHDANAGQGNASGNGSGDPPTYPSLARMQSLPLVSGALRVYEAGKANSRVVQYTSSLVSTSLRHASSHLPAGSGERIDEFAGGMLDRLDKYRRSPAPPPLPPPPTSASAAPGVQRRGKTLDGSGYEREYEGQYEQRGAYEDRQRGAYEDSQQGATSPFVAPPPPPPGFRDRDHDESGRGRGKRREDGGGRADGSAGPGPGGEEQQVAVAQRSRWQAVLLEAGGLSAALSDESMRKLRYCLQWLQYATQHIDAQILILRDFIASLHPLPPPNPNSDAAQAASNGLSISTSASANPEPELTPDHLRTLAHLRSDIVHTIRQVVGVVSKYAGGALPEPARGRVRGFILDLPKRFSADAASPVGGGGGFGAAGGPTGSATGSSTGTGTAARRGARRERGAGAESHPGSPTASRPGSPHLRPLHPHAPGHAHHGGHSRRGSASAAPMEAGKAMAAAQRVLTLATESLDMMRGVTAVVGDSLDRADAYVFFLLCFYPLLDYTLTIFSFA
ncbi:transcription factor Opi1-domain-containing protein [Mycena crocata]|nr:transcription factor Opi1-domain-containing protein [Mycena crocata]